MDRVNHKYDDIINLPHHTSNKYPRMSMQDRAAQFSPFAALTGHAELIDETARLTDKKIELTDDEKIRIDEKLQIIRLFVGREESFSFTYFVADTQKCGGAYISYDGSIKKIDEIKKIIYLVDGASINIEDILDVKSEVFKHFEIDT